MSGTQSGGRRAAQTNIARYGLGFYSRIGAVGGSRKVPKGFAIRRDIASSAGRKGGEISKRGPQIKLNEPVKIDHDKLDRMVADE